MGTANDAKRPAVTPLSDYLGLNVYTEDDKKLGCVRSTTLERAAQDVDYLIIDRPGRDTAVPLSVVQRTDKGLLVPVPKRFVKSAPRVNLRNDVLTPQDKQALEDYYLGAA